MSIPFANFIKAPGESPTDILSGASKWSDYVAKQVNIQRQKQLIDQASKLFPGEMTKQGLTNNYQKLVNDWYDKVQQADIAQKLAQASKAPSEIFSNYASGNQSNAQARYLGAETLFKNQQVANPLLGTTGDAGQIGALIYLAQHPELDKLFGSQTNDQLSSPSGALLGQQEVSSVPQIMTPGSRVGNLQITPQMARQFNNNQPQPTENTEINGVSLTPDQLSKYQEVVQNAPQQNTTPIDLLKRSIIANQQSKNARAIYEQTMPMIRSMANPSMLALAATNRDVARNMANQFANQLAPGTKASDADVNNFMKYAQDATIKKTRTANQINQAMYASNLDALLDQGSELMPSVVKYAGVAGKFKTAKDAASAAIGTMPEDYSNYLKFINVTVPMMSGEISRTLGKQATDQETKVLTKVSNPDYWNSNPELALKQWNWLVESVKGKSGIGGINQSISSSNTDIMNKLVGGASGNQQQSITKSIGGKNYIFNNGKWYEQ